jgi:Leucine-rich repeat (LRR) protein
MGFFGSLIGFDQAMGAVNAVLADYLIEKADADTKKRIAQEVVRIVQGVQRGATPDAILENLTQQSRVVQMNFVALACDNLGIDPPVPNNVWTRVENPYRIGSQVDATRISVAIALIEKESGVRVRWLGNNYRTDFKKMYSGGTRLVEPVAATPPPEHLCQYCGEPQESFMETSVSQCCVRCTFEEIDFNGKEPDDVSWQNLPTFRRLSKLNASKTSLTDAQIRTLSRMKTLTTLNLSETNITDANLKHLSYMTWLEDLDLDDTQITDAGLKHIGYMTGLTSLSVGRTLITDDGLEHLSHLNKLTFLNLGGTEITDDGLEHFARFDGFQSLCLMLSGTEITDDGLEHLSHMSGLTTLYLGYTAITDEGLEHLSYMTELISLSLRGTAITDDGLEHLSHMEGLTKLDLSDTLITEDGLERLRESAALTVTANPTTEDGDPEDDPVEDGDQSEPVCASCGATLESYEQDEEFCISCEPESADLSGKEVTEGSLSQLSQMKRLKVLNLSRSTITDDGLKYISHMTVGKLYLGRTQITDAGIKHLARMTGLKFLSLAGTQITAGSIEHISQMTGLEELYLGRTNITEGELERLRENIRTVTAN